MHDQRHVLAVVGAHVGEPEPGGHLHVVLDRSHLPAATEHVGHVEVDLGAVERALAFPDHVAELVPLERVLEPPFRRVPLLVRPEAILRTRRELGMGLESEQAVQVAHVVDAAVDLGRDLLLGAEDVRVVLRDVANAREAVQRSGELVAVQRCSLCVADRQVAVAP